jgi:hypothetical protein
MSGYCITTGYVITSVQSEAEEQRTFFVRLINENYIPHGKINDSQWVYGS